jgi:hypothetical protein
MENDKFGLIKVESSIVSAGNNLLKLQNSCLANYYADLRKWWNELNDDWKRELVYYFIDDEGLPQELAAQGKAFTKNRNNPENSDWEILIEVNGRITREPYDFELEKLTLIRHLEVSNGHIDLHPINKLLYLESLSGRLNRELTSLKGIEYLTRLKVIDLPHSRIFDLEPLRNLIEIESLNFYDSDIENLDPLTNLRELRSLRIGAALSLTNLSPLSNFNELVNLDCSSNSDIDRRIDFSPIGALTNLEKLDCSGNFIETLKFLKDLKMLESLSLGDSYFSDDTLVPLANLRRLKRLRLSHTNIHNLSPLIDMPSLKYLWVDKTKIPDYQIKEFSMISPACEVIVKDNTFFDGTCVFYKDGRIRHEILRHG